jgi:prophage maintenance system killer protein
VFRINQKSSWKGGNKRTATHICEAFLELIRYMVDYERREIIELVLAIEADEWSVDEIEDWFRWRIKKSLA